MSSCFLKLPEGGARAALPCCGSLRRVVNLSGRDVRVEFCQEADAASTRASWHPLVPVVRAGTAYEPAHGGIYLPRAARLRTVPASSSLAVGVVDGLHHGFACDGAVVVVPPDE